MAFAESGHTIATEKIPFKPLAPGVHMRVVYLDADTGSWTIMIRGEKGSVLPRHQHLAQAEIYILAGAGNHPQTGEFRTGDYVIEPPNAVHDELVQQEEMLLIMRSSGPVAFLNDDGSTAFMMDVNMLEGFQAHAA
ncbi:hypothetical protein FOS14_20975 [Skermania sp. ID1734]|uniref:cupin domain-containing protein n=1 Tax=Skermania sp. ID1734 TaxID=2597516 RepID=UPI0011806312|nr:cupin domain-containing protein [Skermania sp. ID1734]TSD94233.1 hypothetical protein FOS14_20975 [Skermania sp. ID1734]